MPLFRSLVTPSLAGATLAAAILMLAGCRGATDAFGTDASAARSHASAFASALEQRFTRVVRTPKFSNARMRIARYAFAPSKLVGDTALWTSIRTTKLGAERGLDVSGTMVGTPRDGHYTFSARNLVATPVATGDSRHRVGLKALAVDNEWEWSTMVENAVGTMPPARASAVMRALFAAAEQSPGMFRVDYARASPRTTKALGRMFSLDSIVSVRQADGSALVSLQLIMSGERLRPEFPELSKYVSKYLEPATFSLRLTDLSGSDWVTVKLDRLRTTVRFRSRNGELQPLLGSARSMPDTLKLHADASAKLSLFTVGASNITGDFVHIREPNVQAWDMRFATEPEWRLPLISERLLSSPLRRPFEGQGVRFRIGVETGSAGQTLLRRTMTAVVQESAIMRFLGNLGFTAMSDFAGKVEEEESRFIAEWFAAMRADLGGGQAE